MYAKSVSYLIKNKVKNVGHLCNLYADLNRCVFKVCLKDCSVRIVLIFSGNLFQSSEARIQNACYQQLWHRNSVEFMTHLFLTKSIVSSSGSQDRR